MRFRTFIRKQIDNDRAEFIQFGPEHYKKAGVPYAPYGGMPVLEAYELMNDLNRNQSEHHFVYYLASSRDYVPANSDMGIKRRAQ